MIAGTRRTGPDDCRTSADSGGANADSGGTDADIRREPAGPGRAGADP